MLRKRKTQGSPKDRNAQRQSRERGLPSSGAPGAAGPGWAWRQRHRVAAPRTASRRGAASLPGSGGLSRCSVTLHICASGMSGGKRAAGSWEAAASWMQFFFFFIFLNRLQTLQKLHIYLFMILTFCHLLLPLRTWPV